MIFIVILLLSVTSAEDCDDIICSNIFDQVCGIARTPDGNMDVSKYQNICHMRKIQCKLQSIVELEQVPEIICNIKRKKQRRLRGGRRTNDFSIVGAHQPCNHTCPTYCVDTYEPACAQIRKRGKTKSSFRPMINHCHIDMLSCSLGVNVTIHAIGKCYKNPSGLLFMSTVAAMKSLHLLEDLPVSEAGRRAMGNHGIDVQMEKLLGKLFSSTVSNES